MSLTLELSPEAERALKKEADAADVPSPVFAERLLYRSLNLPERTTSKAGALAQLFSWQDKEKARTEEQSAEGITAEDAEWDEISANIERSRVRFPIPDLTDKD